MRFLHTADLHLDSPLRGLDQHPGAPVEQVRGATRRAFDNLITTAIQEQVDLIVIAGDLYDGDWLDHNTGLFFTKGMTQLAEANIPVVIVRGNHDATSRLTKALRLPRNVRLLSDTKPDTVVYEHIGVAVHGQSFIGADLNHDLAASYPARRNGLFNLGLLHTSLNGHSDHKNYAPTTLQCLQNKNYDYWGLGHVHAAKILLKDPWVVFPGNTQGRHIRESGPKGCAMISVENNVVTDHQFIALDVMRWDSLTLQISELPDLDALLDAFTTEIHHKRTKAEERTLAIRVHITGSGSLHNKLAATPETIENELRSATIEASNAQVWLEKVTWNTRPPLDLDLLAKRDDPLGMLIREMRELTADQTLRVAVGEEALRSLHAKLPTELREGPNALQLLHPDELAILLNEVEGELLAHLAGEGGVS